jgi:hypothetical protein
MLVTAAASSSLAQKGSIPQAETDAIVARFQTAYADTFNRRDAKAMAALLTEDATLQNEWGDVTKGRANIVDRARPETGIAPAKQPEVMSRLPATSPRRANAWIIRKQQGGAGKPLQVCTNKSAQASRPIPTANVIRSGKKSPARSAGLTHNDELRHKRNQPEMASKSHIFERNGARCTLL